MISASDINKKVHKAKIEQRKTKMDEISEQQKIKNDRINSELLEVEKAINKFDREVTNKSINLELARYINVPIILSNDVVKILKDEGYFIFNISEFKKDSIKNEQSTRLYFNEKDYNKDLYKHSYRINTEAYKILTNSCKSTKIENQERGYKPVTEGIKVDKMSTLNQYYEDLDKHMQKFKNTLDKQKEGIENSKKETELNNDKEILQIITDNYKRNYQIQPICLTSDISEEDMQEILKKVQEEIDKNIEKIKKQITQACNR